MGTKCPCRALVLLFPLHLNKNGQMRLFSDKKRMYGWFEIQFLHPTRQQQSSRCSLDRKCGKVEREIINSTKQTEQSPKETVLIGNYSKLICPNALKQQSQTQSDIFTHTQKHFVWFRVSVGAPNIQ